MQKVSHEWQKYLKDGVVDKKYWQGFKENAEAAAVELKEVETFADAMPILEDILQKSDTKSIAGVGADESSKLSTIYDVLGDNYTVYTDKFDIAKNAPTIDVGITSGEFGVSETGSVCVDNYSYEARVASMLPPINVVFMNRNYIVNTMTDAFGVISHIFDKGYTGFVTGPSRTSDIERVLTLGVHGPSRLILFAVNRME